MKYFSSKDLRWGDSGQQSGSFWSFSSEARQKGTATAPPRYYSSLSDTLRSCTSSSWEGQVCKKLKGIQTLNWDSETLPSHPTVPNYCRVYLLHPFLKNTDKVCLRFQTGYYDMCLFGLCEIILLQYLWWSDPFLEFHKQTEAGWQLAHRTEVHSITILPPLSYGLTAVLLLTAACCSTASYRLVSPRWWKTTWIQHGGPSVSLCSRSVEATWRNPYEYTHTRTRTHYHCNNCILCINLARCSLKSSLTGWCVLFIFFSFSLHFLTCVCGSVNSASQCGNSFLTKVCLRPPARVSWQCITKVWKSLSHARTHAC